MQQSGVNNVYLEENANIAQTTLGRWTIVDPINTSISFVSEQTDLSPYPFSGFTWTYTDLFGSTSSFVATIVCEEGNHVFLVNFIFV